MFEQARQGFAALHLDHWVAQVDQLLATAQRHVWTLDDIARMLRLTRQGDQQSGQRVWDLAEDLSKAADRTQTALGRGLQKILAGMDPESALVELPDDLRTQLLAKLRESG